jgi:hypothetical protein
MKAAETSYSENRGKSANDDICLLFSFFYLFYGYITHMAVHMEAEFW